MRLNLKKQRKSLWKDRKKRQIRYLQVGENTYNSNIKRIYEIVKNNLKNKIKKIIKKL